MTLQGIDILAPSLAENSGLRVLNLSRNFIGDDGLRALTKALVSNSCLISLSLAANGITSRGTCMPHHTSPTTAPSWNLGLNEGYNPDAMLPGL